MNTDYGKRWRRENHARDLARKRQYRASNPDRTRRTRKARAKARHAPGADIWRANAWQVQAGRCYLCGDALDISTAALDHDHRCCAYGASCATCRRGLTCNRCNLLIGLVEDSPDLLRRIAEGLESALADVGRRMAERPEQMSLSP